MKKDFTILNDIRKAKFLIIDMNSGRYLKENTGHEKFNLEKNSYDERYYGYCPPFGGINISRLGAKRTDEYIDGIIVIYTQKLSGTPNREILAFTLSARVYRKPQVDKRLNRKIGREHCEYHVVSDELFVLEKLAQKPILDIASVNPHLLRRQRHFSGDPKYSEFDANVYRLLADVLAYDKDDDAELFQQEVNESKETLICQNSSEKEPEYKSGENGIVVNKKANVSKAALNIVRFQCAYDSSHTTFQTAQKKPYMEGHHLIPCTYSNAKSFWENQRRNIDCVENIVCLCPTCHRRIHFGSDSEKVEVIEKLFDKQSKALEAAGIKVTLDELKRLYKI